MRPPTTPHCALVTFCTLREVIRCNSDAAGAASFLAPNHSKNRGNTIKMSRSEEAADTHPLFFGAPPKIGITTGPATPFLPWWMCDAVGVPMPDQLSLKQSLPAPGSTVEHLHARTPRFQGPPPCSRPRIRPGADGRLTRDVQGLCGR